MNMTRTGATSRKRPPGRVQESPPATLDAKALHKDRAPNGACTAVSATGEPRRPATNHAPATRKAAACEAPVSALELVEEERSQLARMPASAQRLSGADRWCLAALLALPLAVFGLPALFGHLAVFGDDATQNYPLRVLVGSQIRQGHLPLLNPYIWSGAPLLGGWNAGAAYPMVLLFVFLSGPVAWTLSLVGTFWMAGVGCFAFLRASRLGPVPSLLGSLSFSFAGAMTADMHHIGLVEGVSWAPVVLLALLRLSETMGAPAPPATARRPVRRSRIGWAAVLAAAGGMVILAGEPRAIADVGVMIAVYGAWRAVRVGRSAVRYLFWVAAGLLLALGLGAVQWLPGIAAVSTSQRAVASASLFSYGSLANRWILLSLVPDLLGGSGSFGLPQFLGHARLPDVTGYVGLMPLVACFALLGRLRLGRAAPEWLVWHVMALVGILLALGGNTPLWHLLIRVPFFGGQRLQSRSIVIADMGFAFLLAYWAEAWLGDARARRALPRGLPGPPGGGSRHRRTSTWRFATMSLPRALSPAELQAAHSRRSRVFGAIPALAAFGALVVALCWGAGLLQWMGVSRAAAVEDGLVRLGLVPFVIVSVAAIAISLRGHLLAARRRAQVLVGLVVFDIVVFTMMTVVAVLPSLGHSSAASALTAPTSTTSRPARIGADAIFPRGYLASPAPAISAAAFSGTGRFAVYDPDGIDSAELGLIEQPDLNAVSGVASVQGYGSIVDGAYASATGSHGVDILSPRAIGDGTLDQLDTTVLLAPRDYFLVSAVSDPAAPRPGAGERKLAPGGRTTWYLGEDVAITGIAVADGNAARDLASGLRFGALTADGAVLWAASPSLTSADLLGVSFAHSPEVVALIAQAGGTRADLGPPSVSTTDGVYLAEGQLEGVVVPPHWAFQGLDGSFAVFANRFVAPALSLRGSARASIRATAGLPFAPTSAAVSSPSGVEVIRAEAAIPGWSAIWRPQVGMALRLVVRRVGVVQAVQVPGGRGVLTFTYNPPGFDVGWMMSALALALLAALGIWVLVGHTRVGAAREA